MHSGYIKFQIKYESCVNPKSCHQNCYEHLDNHIQENFLSCIWNAYSVTDGPSIIHEFASMTILLIISLTVPLDSVREHLICIPRSAVDNSKALLILSGVARGFGQQHITVCELGTFHLIGMTVDQWSLFLDLRCKVMPR